MPSKSVYNNPRVFYSTQTFTKNQIQLLVESNVLEIAPKKVKEYKNTPCLLFLDQLATTSSCTMERVVLRTKHQSNQLINEQASR